MYKEMQVEMVAQKTKTEKRKGEKLQMKRNEQEDVEEGSGRGCGSCFFI